MRSFLVFDTVLSGVQDMVSASVQDTIVSGVRDAVLTYLSLFLSKLDINHTLRLHTPRHMCLPPVFTMA